MTSIFFIFVPLFPIRFVQLVILIMSWSLFKCVLCVNCANFVTLLNATEFIFVILHEGGRPFQALLDFFSPISNGLQRVYAVPILGPLVCSFNEAFVVPLLVEV
uniref:Uncharacterized protein n=1 Tax=Amblyomma americanum TaxID=6943 RepID=A0A0C9SEN9_AMBAM